MFIFLWFVLCDLMFGTAMLAYLWLDWTYLKWKILRNGWTLNRCNPVWPPKQILLLYIPVIGVLWFLIAGSMIYELAYTKREEDTVVTIGAFGFTSSYFE